MANKIGNKYGAQVTLEDQGDGSFAEVIRAKTNGISTLITLVTLASGQSVSPAISIGKDRLSGILVPVTEALTTQLEILGSLDGTNFYPIEDPANSVAYYRIAISQASAHLIKLDLNKLMPFPYFQLKLLDASSVAKVQTSNRAFSLAVTQF